ncbi:hypothetical protein [Mycobacterium sp. MAA66]|uniref:hypothetical protein n=1 Tax=Mycobacterium sp. MAA66 TaxID=3156297 RepID=UPI0035114CD2
MSGPVGPNSTEQTLLATLRNMAHYGSQYRVGLIPDSRRNGWRFQPEISSDAVIDTGLEGGASTQQVLDKVVGNPLGHPVTLSLIGERVCVGLDHGIGDAHILADIIASLSDCHTDVSFLEPRVTDNAAHPLVRALFAQVRNSQSLFRAIEKDLRSTRSIARKAVRTIRTRKSNPLDAVETERYSAVFVTSGPGFANVIRHLRLASGSTASVSSVLMLSIHRALCTAGIPLTDNIEFLVDLRRFLPTDRTTLANFMAVASARDIRASSIDKFADQLREALNSPRILVKVGLSVTLAKMLMWCGLDRRNTWPIPAGSTEGDLTLTVSDLTKTSTRTKTRWSQPEVVEISVAMPPASRSHVSAAIWLAPNDSVQITATYFPSKVDGAALRAALEDALRPELPTRVLEVHLGLDSELHAE